jgi:hypothetical protein
MLAAMTVFVAAALMMWVVMVAAVAMIMAVLMAATMVVLENQTNLVFWAASGSGLCKVPLGSLSYSSSFFESW